MFLLLWVFSISKQPDPGNMGNIVFVIPLIPALLLTPVDFIVIPIFLFKRLRRRDRSDLAVQLLSVALLLFIILWFSWGSLTSH